MLSIVMLLIAATTRPEVMVQVGLGTQLRSVALSPDGKRALTAGHDSAVKLWDVDKRSIIRLLPTGNVSSQVLFTLDGRRALALPGSLLVLDLETAKVVAGSALAGMYYKLSPDGQHAAVFTMDGKVHVTNTKDFADVHLLEGGNAFAFSFNGKEIVTASANELFFYDLPSGKKTGTAKLETPAHGGVWWAPDGNIVTQADGKTVAYTRAGKRLWTSDMGHLAQSPDGSVMVSCSTEGIAFFDPATGVRKPAFAPPYSRCRDISVSNNGARVLWGDYEDAAVYDVATRTTAPLRALGSFPRAAVVAPDDHTIASGNEDGLIRLWDSSTGQMIDSAVGARGDRGKTTALAYSKDGKTLVSGHETGEVVIWDVAPLRERMRTNTCADRIDHIVLGDGVVYSSCGGFWIRDRGAVFKWAFGRREAASEIVRYADSSENYGLALSNDGAMLYIKQFNWVHAYATTTGAEVFKGEHKGSGLSLTPDGKTLLTMTNDGKRDHLLWLTAATGQEVRRCSIASIDSFNGVALTSDPKTVSAMSYFSPFLVDAETCAVRPTNVHHRGVVTSVALLNGGKQMMSASKNESTIRIVNTATSTEQVQLLAIANGGYVTITPDGYYVSSKDATNAITFTLGLNTYSYDLFDLRLNRPDIVAERLGIAPKATIDLLRAAVDKRLKKAGFTRSSFGDDFNVPEIKVSDVANAGAVDLQVQASDKKGLDRLLVSINGVPMKARGETLGRASTAKKTLHVPLSAGANQVQISALNTAGIESERVLLQRAGPTATPSKLYVVAIGVSKYKQNEYDLDYAAKDATDIATLLATEKGRYTDVSVDVLTDAAVTVDKVRALKTKLAGSTVDDAVIVFVAGHGLLDDKLDYYLATHDVAFEHPADKGLAWSELEALVEDIPARRRLLLIDACHSGEVDKDEVTTTKSAAVAMTAGALANGGAVQARGLKRVVSKNAGSEAKPLSTLVQELFVDLSHGSGANVLSSATGTQYAFESKEWSNGVFTFALIEALKARQADTNKDQKVTLDELRSYVPPRVGQLTAGHQTPTARALNPLIDMGL